MTNGTLLFLQENEWVQAPNENVILIPAGGWDLKGKPAYVP